MPPKRILSGNPLLFALCYAVFGAAYILFSDRLLISFAGDYEHYQVLEIAKGWVFVIVTSVGLWAMLRRGLARLSRIARAAMDAEDRLLMALTAAGGMIWQARTSDIDGGAFWQVSGGLAKQLGLPEGPFMGIRELAAFVHPADLAGFHRWAADIAAYLPDVGEGLFRFRSADRSYRWIKLVPDPHSPMHHPAGVLFGVAFDLTQQQMVSQDLTEVIFGAELGTWRLDIATGQNKINDRWAELLGYTRAEVEPMTDLGFFAMVHPDDLAHLRANQADRWRQKNYLFTDEIRMRHKDGHWVWVLTRCRPVEFSATGEPLVLSGVHIDISARKALEAELALESNFLRQVTETSVSGILVLNDQGLICFANKEAANIFDQPHAEMSGQPISHVLQSVTELDGTLLAPRDYPYAQVIATQTTLRDRRLVIHPRHGSAKSIAVNAAPMTLPDGRVQVVISVSDITDQLANEALLRKSAAAAKSAALHDPMTGLPNRKFFEDYLGTAIIAAKVSGTSLLHAFLDLDNFKQVNDRFGHQVGDLMIRKVAERLEGIRQANQFVARMTSDEFTFLHPFAAGDDTSKVLLSLASAFDLPFDLEGRLVYVTVSMGVSVYPEDATASEDLWLHADLAMYEAKARGRNQTVRFSAALRDRQIKEGRIAQILQRAIKNRAFTIVLQPLVQLDLHGSVEGAEALVRCTDPDLDGIGPLQFLPVAERTGLMRSIDLLVVDLVGAAVARLRAAGVCLRISINLSPDSVQQTNFGQELLSHLAEWRLGASDVMFELTEGALIDLSTHARETLDMLHDHGFDLSADDFGTGYSSLSYLHRLRLKEIKIDRSFIVRLGSEDEPSEQIVGAILAMGRSLGLRVVAEGVESEPQAQWLRRNGCMLGQGFHFGRGVDVDTFVMRHLTEDLPKAVAVS